MRSLSPEPLTAAAFAPFGDVLDASGAFRLINAGLCQRHDDLARLQFSDGRPGLSVFLAQTRRLPCTVELIERHPLGSQAFLPMHAHPFLVFVAHDPAAVPRAFLTNGAQGINLAPGTWHGVLTPLATSPPDGPQAFAVLDRIGSGPNLQEHHYAEPWTVLETVPAP